MLIKHDNKDSSKRKFSYILGEVLSIVIRNTGNLVDKKSIFEEKLGGKNSFRLV